MMKTLNRIFLLITLAALSVVPSLSAQTEEELDRLLLGDLVDDRDDGDGGTNDSESECPFTLSGQAEYNSGFSLAKSEFEQNRFYSNQGRIKLKPSYEIEGFRAYADIDYFLNSEADTETRDNNSLECVEAYIEGSGLLLWKIGKQRFNWGVGDSYQPTDLMDQPDLRDSFMRENDDRYTGVYALSLKYLIRDYALEAAVRPITAKALSPSGFYSVGTDDIDSPARKVSVRYSEGEASTKLKDISGGLRFGGTTSIIDWHLMYYSGLNRELLYRNTLTNEEGRMYLDSQPAYQRMNAIGADLSFALSKLNIRLEGLYSPDMTALSSIEHSDLNAALSELNAGASDAGLQSLESRQFFNYSAGFDIKLWGDKGTVYMEWMQSRYMNEDHIVPLLLTDILMLRAEDSLFNQSLNLTVGSMIRVRDGSAGLGVKGEAEYDFKTGLTAELGGYFFIPEGDDYIKLLNDQELAYLHIKYCF